MAGGVQGRCGVEGVPEGGEERGKSGSEGMGRVYAGAQTMPASRVWRRPRPSRLASGRRYRIMTRSLGVKTWATSAVVLAAVTGCAGSGSEADPGHPTQVGLSALSSTSPTASPNSESEVASAAAEQVVRRYFAVLDGLRQDPSEPVQRLSAVATSTQLAAQRRLLTSERGKHLHQVGATRVADLTVQSVNLDNSNPSAGQVPTVTVDVCWDVSDVDIVDESGKSTVPPHRANTGATRYTVANYHWSKNPSDGWRLATGRDLEQASCPAS